jgi:hypothetical protein
LRLLGASECGLPRRSLEQLKMETTTQTTALAIAPAAQRELFTLPRMRQLSRSVDKLASLNAKIAKLQGEAELLKIDLKSSGMTEIVGKKHKAVISERETCRLDAAKAKAMLTPAQIAKCTSTSKSTAINVYDL